MFHLKGIRPRKASPTPSRHGKRQAQSPAAVVQRPDLTGLYAAVFPYQPSTIEFLRARAAWCRATADDLDTHARDDIAWAAHRRGEAADLDRMADQAEQDAPQTTASAWSCPCGCSPLSCLYCDAGCACGPECPNCKHLAKLGAGPTSDAMAGLTVHFNDGRSFWPPCPEREGATWSTGDPSRVTCRACLAVMSTWTPTSEAVAAGWNEPLTAPPVTAVLEAVDGGTR